MEAGFCRTDRHVPKRPSPRFKKLSPKPELPKKPRKPERVEDPAANSVRQANYQAELAAWEAAKTEHDKLMQKRKAKPEHSPRVGY